MQRCRPVLNIAGRGFLPQDDRILLLFDLNGVLLQHTFDEGRHKHYLRPGAEHLIRLNPHFRIGVFTSATVRTAIAALNTLHAALEDAVHGSEAAAMLQQSLFEIVLCRQHTISSEKAGVVRPEGANPWDTVKPLGQYFSDKSRVLLIDDSPHKALPGEEDLMVSMPCWHGPDSAHGQNDECLKVLVDSFLELHHKGETLTGADMAASVSARLALASPPAPRPSAMQVVPQETAPGLSGQAPAPPLHSKLPQQQPAAAATNHPKHHQQKVSFQTPIQTDAGALRALQDVLIASIPLCTVDGISSTELNLLFKSCTSKGCRMLMGQSTKPALNDLVRRGVLRATKIVDGTPTLKMMYYSLIGPPPSDEEFSVEIGIIDVVDKEQVLKMAALLKAYDTITTNKTKKTTLITEDDGSLLEYAKDVRETFLLYVIHMLSCQSGAKRERLLDFVREQMSTYGLLNMKTSDGKIARKKKKWLNGQLAKALEMTDGDGTSRIQKCVPNSGAAGVMEVPGHLWAYSVPPCSSTIDLYGAVLNASQALKPLFEKEFAEGDGAIYAEDNEDDAEIEAAIDQSHCVNGLESMLHGNDDGALLEVFEDVEGVAPSSSGGTAPLLHVQAPPPPPPPPQELGPLAHPPPPLTDQGATPMTMTSALHREIIGFAKAATPTKVEADLIKEGVRKIDMVARSLWPHAETVLFGSQATGLALPGGDMDIAILGVGAQLNVSRAAVGFTPQQRRGLTQLLEELLDALTEKTLIVGKAQIIGAKVPIIKCRINLGEHGVAADISLGALNGAAAVELIRKQVLAVPPLRPLTLIIKALLREKGLKEVFSGGLSSYTITNMVLAHLQCEGYSIASLDVGNDSSHRDCAQYIVQSTFDFIDELAKGTLDADLTRCGSGSNNNSTGRSCDLGVLLYTFLERFGRKFSYARQAVSVRMGGLCGKIGLWRNPRKPWLLAVEDPQQPGKDIGGASFAIADVRAAFLVAAESVAECCEDVEANGAVSLKKTKDGGILGALIDAEAAVGRSKKEVQARHAMDTKSALRTAIVRQDKLLHTVRGGRISKHHGAPVNHHLHHHILNHHHHHHDVAMGKQAQHSHVEAEKTKGRRREKRTAQKVGKAVQKGPGKGTKRSRLVQAQWKDQRGQYFDDDDDDFQDHQVYPVLPQKKGKRAKASPNSRKK